MVELTRGGVIRLDADGVSHWTYEMHSSNGPIGHARRCDTASFSVQVINFLPINAPTAAHVTCVVCLASEG